MSPTGPAPAFARREQPALLLRRFPFGESSLVLHILTPEAGRVALLAKGAYRPSSGFFAAFDLFDTLRLRWSSRPGQELGLVTRAQVHARRAALAEDLERYRAGLGLLELAQATAREGHEEHILFRWLEGWLDLLQAGQVPAGLVTIAAGLGLLRQNGLAPAFLACASCGATPGTRTGRVPFSTARGGRLCSACAALEHARGQALESLSLNVMRVAASLMEATPAMLAHTRLESDLTQTLRGLVARFLEYHLDTRLRSR